MTKEELELWSQCAPEDQKLGVFSILTSFLLRCPLEVRNRIYRHLLGDRVIHIHPTLAQWEVFEDLETPCLPCYYCDEEYDEHTSQPWYHSVCKYPETIVDEYTAFHADPPTLPETYASHLECSTCVNEPSNLESLDLRILRSCRQLYDECNQILWTTNTFAFSAESTLNKFMITRSPLQKKLLRTIYIRNDEYRNAFGWNNEHPPSMKIVKSFTGLRTVHIHLSKFLCYDLDYGFEDSFASLCQSLCSEPGKFLCYLADSMRIYWILKSLSKATVIVEQADRTAPSELKQRRKLAKWVEGILLKPANELDTEIRKEKKLWKKRRRSKEKGSAPFLGRLELLNSLVADG